MATAVSGHAQVLFSIGRNSSAALTSDA